EIQAIVDPVIRDAALTELYQRWALTDIPKLLEHLSARNPNLPQWEELLKHTLVLAAESNAEAVLGYAQQTDGNLALQAEASALEVIAMNDPGSATAYLATMNLGRRRHVVAAAVATGYARNDPDAAVAWVRQLNPRVEEAEKALIATVATNDL